MESGQWLKKGDRVIAFEDFEYSTGQMIEDDDGDMEEEILVVDRGTEGVVVETSKDDHHYTVDFSGHGELLVFYMPRNLEFPGEIIPMDATALREHQAAVKKYMSEESAQCAQRAVIYRRYGTLTPESLRDFWRKLPVYGR